MFAATAIVYSFLILVTCAAYVLSSVLARYQSIKDLPASIRNQFFLSVAFLIVITPVVFKITSPLIFSLLFPKFGEDAKALLGIVGWTIPFVVLIAMMPTTPGSAGVSEGGVAALYGVFLNSYLLGVFVLLFRLITYHMGLIAGAIFQYKIFRSITTFSTDMMSDGEESS